MRVHRAFGFIDLSGFTSFTDTHGDQQAVAVLANVRAAVRDISSRRGVRVGKWLGDGSMFVSLDPSWLVQTILEIEQRVEDERSPLALRAGLAVGDVILFEGDDYIGRAVNLAARLCDLAGPNETLATVDFAEHIPPWSRVSDAGPLSIRGFLQPVPAVRICRRDGEEPAVVDPVCGMRLPVDAVVETRADGKGAALSFCSASCADAWDEQRPARDLGFEFPDSPFSRP